MKQSRRKRTRLNFINLIGSGLAVLSGLLLFVISLLPVHQPQLNLKDYGGVEPVPDGGSYLWVAPGTVLKFYDLPRFAPVYLKLRMSLDRIEGVPPARVELIERQGQGNPDLKLAGYEYTSARTGFQDYILKIPPAEKSRESFLLVVNSNGFRAPGDPRELGVRIESVSLRLSPGGLLSLLYPRPYLLAIGLLLLAMTAWCYLLRFRFLEALPLLATLGFASGVLANILVYSSWLLLLLAALILACAFWFSWATPSSFFDFDFGFEIEPGSDPPTLAAASPPPSPRSWLWLPLPLALALFAACFALVPGLPGDIYYWRQVLQPIIQHGPLAVYPFAPRLVYPPGSVFFLWLYGLFTQPFGLSYTQGALKLLMGLSHFGLLVLLYYAGIKTKVAPLALARALLLLGFSLSLVFVPVSWVQADGWLALLMIAPLMLVLRQKPFTSALLQAIAIVYKAQSWLLLPLYGLIYLWQNGWRKSIVGGTLCIGLVLLIGGLGFGFDGAVWQVFWAQPAVSGENAWGGIRSFNLLHALGYDQKQVPQPWLALSYGAVVFSYGLIMWGLWRHHQAFDKLSQPQAKTKAKAKTKATSQTEAHRDSDISLAKARIEALRLADWLVAAGLLFLLIFYLWVKMHERYLYFGLIFLPFGALWRREIYKVLGLFNFIFMLNLLYAYLPERRDPVPNNFLLWRQALHAGWVQNLLVGLGLIGCLWLAWLYFRPARLDKALSQPDPEKVIFSYAEKEG